MYGALCMIIITSMSTSARVRVPMCVHLVLPMISWHSSTTKSHLSLFVKQSLSSTQCGEHTRLAGRPVSLPALLPPRWSLHAAGYSTHMHVAMEQIKPAALATNATHTSLAYKNKPIFVFQEEIIPQTAWLLKVNVYQCMDAFKA